MTVEDHGEDWQKSRARELRREMTVPERRLWYALRDRRLAAWKFRRQSPIGPYIVDFYCHAASFIVEVDGRSHDDRYESDRSRQAELEARGLNVLRISNDDVIYHLEDVLNAILGALARGGDPAHSRQYRTLTPALSLGGEGERLVPSPPGRGWPQAG